MDAAIYRRRAGRILGTCAACIWVTATPARADNQVVEHPLGSTTAPYGFVEYLPPAYDSSPTAFYPTILMLHGAGEVGDGKTDPGFFDDCVKNGPLRIVRNQLAVDGGANYFGDQNVLVFAPQSPVWWDSTTIDQFFQYLIANYRVDPNRIYITGLSMGGGGTWEYAVSHPDRAVAIVPVAGASDTYGRTQLPEFDGVWVWAFHNWNDPTVPSRSTVDFGNVIANTQAPGTDNLLAGYPNGDYPGELDGGPSQAAPNIETGVFGVSSGWTWDAGVVVDDRSPLLVTFFILNQHDSWTQTYCSDGSCTAPNKPVWNWLLSKTKGGPLPDGGTHPGDAGWTPGDAGFAEDAGQTTDAGGSGGASGPDGTGPGLGGTVFGRMGCSTSAGSTLSTLGLLVLSWVFGRHRGVGKTRR